MYTGTQLGLDCTCLANRYGGFLWKITDIVDLRGKIFRIMIFYFYKVLLNRCFKRWEISQVIGSSAQ